MICLSERWLREGRDGLGCRCRHTSCMTASNGGPLGSCIDEERSKLRYVVRIAEFSESSSLRTHIAPSWTSSKARPAERRLFCRKGQGRLAARAVLGSMLVCLHPEVMASPTSLASDKCWPPKRGVSVFVAVHLVARSWVDVSRYRDLSSGETTR